MSLFEFQKHFSYLPVPILLEASYKILCIAVYRCSGPRHDFEVVPGDDGLLPAAHEVVGVGRRRVVRDGLRAGVAGVSDRDRLRVRRRGHRRRHVVGGEEREPEGQVQVLINELK